MSNEEMFSSSRHARLYLASFFFVHTTVLWVFPTFLRPTSANILWLFVLMAVYVPAFGLGVFGMRYLPLRERGLFGRERRVYAAAIDEAGLKDGRWMTAFYICRGSLWVALVVLVIGVASLP